MVEAIYLFGAGALSFCGVGWLALAKPPHWEQVRGPGPHRGRSLQLLGVFAVTLSLVSCLAADHPSIASLVWVMLLTASSLLVTFTLAWRPRWLAWLVGWVRTPPSPPC